MKRTLRIIASLLSLVLAAGIMPLAAAAEGTKDDCDDGSCGIQDGTVFNCVSPVGCSAVDRITQAPRLDTLEGKTIALVGRSFNAAITQDVLKECILEDYPTATVLTNADVGCGGVFSIYHRSSQSLAYEQKLIEMGVDCVISGNCGCGLCTAKETGNSLAAEYLGIPTVTVASTAFVPEVHITGVNMGVAVLRTAEYPGAFSSDSVSELRRKSREIIYPLVVEALTTAITQEEIDEYADQGMTSYDDVLISGTYDVIQEYYREAGYTDGLPIGLPTQQAVEEYLEYTPYNGSDVLGIYPLAYRECRVYTVAANAIMAGCPPEYMPLCIAFVKCMGDGEWRRPLASTHGWTPYAWLNGPVARQLGIDCGQGMISEQANKILGRFIELAMMNIGGYYVKENRMGTFGYMTPWVFSEDERACLDIGWEPYHVEKGYSLNSNTLTAASMLEWGNNITPATTDAGQIMQLMAWDITEKQQNGLGNTNPQVWRTVFVTEPVAANLAESYPTKGDLDDALVATARRPLWLRVYANFWANTGSFQYLSHTIEEHYDMLLADAQEQAAMTAVPDWLKPLFPGVSQLMTVATMNAGQTPLLVCGDSTRNKVQVMPGGGYVTVEIELPYNWDALLAESGYAPLESYYLEQEPEVTGPVAVAEELADGTYRLLPSESQLTAKGRLYYNSSTGLLKYWSTEGQAAAELQLDTESDFAKVLSGIGAFGNITVENGVITSFILRPPASGASTVNDTSSLTGAAFEGAELTLAVNFTQSSLAGGVTPSGASLVMDRSVASFNIDLGGELYIDAESDEGFLTYDGEHFVIDAHAAPGAVAKIGVLVSEGVYRTFTFTMGRSSYTVLYTSGDVMENPASATVVPPVGHPIQWGPMPKYVMPLDPMQINDRSNFTRP